MRNQDNFQNLNQISLEHNYSRSNYAQNFDQTFAEHNYSRYSKKIKSSNNAKYLCHTNNITNNIVSDRIQPLGSLIEINNDLLAEIRNSDEHTLGSMDVECTHCFARHFASERVTNKGNSFNDCCNHGLVKLEPIDKFPPSLEKLFKNEHPKSTHFLDRIRVYNNLFSFASLKANLVNFENNRPGPFCYKIHGQIYYLFNTTMQPVDDEKPTNGQLFIIDPNEANDYRMMTDEHLDKNLIELLDEIMRKFNAFAKSYEMLGAELKKYDLKSLELRFSIKPGQNKHCYNPQRANEVAMIFSTNASDEIPDAFVVVKYKQKKELQYISHMNSCVEPWIYPLFYPHGSLGWHENLKKYSSNKRISRSAYVKYRIAIRNEFNAFLYGRRLFQQYLVDFAVKIEKDKMTYLRTQQQQLRVETYEVLHDYLRRNGNENNIRIGKIVILPSTYIGSPRNMLQNYQDAMAIVRICGKPHLFITMTCNPNWKDIKENLLPGQTPSDRPDIVTRVFHLKRNQLIHMITKEKFFGEDVKAHVHVIGFQKRGLPHLHFLVTFKSNRLISDINLIDKCISAEIPDLEEDPILHEYVLKHMIHGPCGDWCLQDNKCSKKYPKKFNDHTTLDDDNYVIYRRRNTNKSYQRKSDHIVDNRDVVPYCPQLLKIFNCHMNVEVVSSTKSVKYLFKYVYKGHDKMFVEVSNDNQNLEYDEIKQYIDTRYIGPCEAAWRILNKKLHDRSHTVVRLPVHLPNKHNVKLNIQCQSEDVRKALEEISMLMAYFELNQKDEFARNLFYFLIPEYYVYKSEKVDDKKVNYWQRRVRKINCIGRMYTVNPSNIELFHLRLLLLKVKGAQSFDELKIVNNITHESFLEACRARGLIEDDNEWFNAMQECSTFMMPNQLRNLFVRLLIHCSITNSFELWDNFKDYMVEDYRNIVEPMRRYKKCLKEIQEMLLNEGKLLSDFKELYNLLIHMSERDDDINSFDDNNCVIDNLDEIAREYKNSLNNEQRKIYDRIMFKLLKNTESNYSDNADNISNCFFINGIGGSGKTFLYKALYYNLMNNNKTVCTMAFTGIAATLLPSGKTLHKIFKLPVPLLANSSSDIKLQSKDANYLEKVDCFIWDEAPMTPRYALAVIDRILRDIVNNNLVFGGKIMILGGDFRQLLPVQKNATRNELIDLSIKFSSFWKYFEQLQLTQNMRTLPEEIEFSKFLLDVGDGKLNDKENSIDISKFPEHIFISGSLADIIKNTYKDIFQNNDFRKGIDTVILATKNESVNEINNIVLTLLDESSERIYYGTDSIDSSDYNNEMYHLLSTEYINTLNPNSLPVYELKLRKYAIVMLIRNLNLKEGLCNGTRLLVLELLNNVLKCEILTEDKKGNIVFIHRITLYSTNDYTFIFKRRQFPIKLAFSMTINKAQGQTFKEVLLDLRKNVFSHGQLYVALSRVRSWASIKIYIGENIHSQSIQNIIFKEVL